MIDARPMGGDFGDMYTVESSYHGISQINYVQLADRDGVCMLYDTLSWLCRMDWHGLERQRTCVWVDHRTKRKAVKK